MRAYQKYPKPDKESLDKQEKKRKKKVKPPSGFTILPVKPRVATPWSNFGKEVNRSGLKTFTIPPDRLNEFIASGLSVEAFLGTEVNKPQEAGIPTAAKPDNASRSFIYHLPIARNQLERAAINRYSQEVEGFTEVMVDAGRIDYLTQGELLEFKVAPGWKHALGQLLVYGFYYPDHKLVLMLVGSQLEDYQAIARQHCDKYGIEVRHF